MNGNVVLLSLPYYLLSLRAAINGYDSRTVKYRNPEPLSRCRATTRLTCHVHPLLAAAVNKPRNAVSDVSKAERNRGKTAGARETTAARPRDKNRSLL